MLVIENSPVAYRKHLLRFGAMQAHRAPIPEEEPLPGEEPGPDEEEPPPHPDPTLQDLPSPGKLRTAFPPLVERFSQ